MEEFEQQGLDGRAKADCGMIRDRASYDDFETRFGLESCRRAAARHFRCRQPR